MNQSLDTGAGSRIVEAIKRQLATHHDIHIDLHCSGLHPDIFFLAAFSSSEPRCTLKIEYPSPQFTEEVLRRNALIPLTIVDAGGPRAVTADELFPDHDDLIRMPGGEVVSRSVHHVVGKVVGNLVFIEPLVGHCSASLYEPQSDLNSPWAPTLTAGCFPEGLPCSLRNMGIDGYPRYDFSATYHGQVERTHILSRVPPGMISHHKSGQTFPIATPELVFIPEGSCHVISLSMDDTGEPRSWYVNINNPVSIGHAQFSWEDWELDIKILPGDDGQYYPLLLDLDEYEDAVLPYSVQEDCCMEIERCIGAIYQQQFPFHLSYLLSASMKQIIDSLYK